MNITFAFFILCACTLVMGATYRAGIAQHAFVDSPQTSPSDLVKLNMLLYQRHAQAAFGNGSQILVFPEFGLLPGPALSSGRAAVLPYTEVIPAVGSNPCSNASFVDFVIRPLSCMAAQYGGVIVANVNEQVPCDTASDPSCPHEGAYTYNSEVAFDERGTLQAHYRKTHPWFTSAYNTPVNQSLVTFTTSFGVRFGLMVCNDIRFPHPRDDLVAAGVRHFPYSVAMDLSIMQWYYIQRFSKNAGAVVLSANAGYDNVAVYVKGDTLASTRVNLGADTKDSLLLFDVPLSP